MSGYKLIEDNSSYKEESLTWDKIQHLFEPEIDILPKHDKNYFQSIIYHLINKEPALSNIPPSHMYAYILRADFIFDLKSYPMLASDEYIRKQVGKLLHRYKIRLSEDAMAFLAGPLSHTTQHIKQEISQPPSIRSE
jgi:hypothetical protein